jgi:hypothetical protein
MRRLLIALILTISTLATTLVISLNGDDVEHPDPDVIHTNR